MKQNFFTLNLKISTQVVVLLVIQFYMYGCFKEDKYSTETQQFLNFTKNNNIKIGYDTTHWFIISSTGCTACRNPKSITNKLNKLHAPVNIISSNNINLSETNSSTTLKDIYIIDSKKIDRLAFFSNITYLRSINNKIDSISYFK